MVFVPLGYADKKVFSFDEVHGASAYGAGTFAGGDGSRQPSQLELDVSETQGKLFAATAAKLAAK
jgi:NAD(P)H dehydrogenase (quinone)